MTVEERGVESAPFGFVGDQCADLARGGRDALVGRHDNRREPCADDSDEGVGEHRQHQPGTIIPVTGEAGFRLGQLLDR